MQVPQGLVTEGLRMIQFLAGPIAKLAGDLIDNLFETEEEKADAKAKLMKLEQQGKLQEMKSLCLPSLKRPQQDPGRHARPTFLYVMYRHHSVLCRRRDRYLVAKRGYDCCRQYPRSARRYS